MSKARCTACSPRQRDALLIAMSMVLLAMLAGATAQHLRIPAQPMLPERFQVAFFASDTASNPLENLGAYVIIAKDGAHLGIHLPSYNSSVYYSLNCSASDANASSYQLSYFNIRDRAEGEPTNQRQCWYAPPGNQIREGQWKVYAEIMKTWLWDSKGWEYGGLLRSAGVPLQLWSRFVSLRARTELAINNVTSEPVSLITNYNGFNYVWEFDPGTFRVFNESETVTMAHTMVDLSTCKQLQIPLYNYEPCEDTQARRSMQTDSIAGELAPNWRQLEELLDASSRGELPYEGAGYFARQYEMVEPNATHPPVWFPVDAGRDLPNVRNQRNCGSCWSFATAVTLSSVFSNKHKTHYTFSPQFFMDCVPKAAAAESGSGCWGGNVLYALDMLMITDSVVPLDLDYPYGAVQGQCDTLSEGVNISLAAYSILRTEAEIKDALVNHGAIAISILADDDFKAWDGYGQQLVASGADVLSIESNAQGLTCFNTTRTDHAVNLVGWAPCMVRTENPTYTQGSCWVVQNTWGTDAGYAGLWLINMDRQYDCGVHLQPVIPLLH